MEKSSTIDSTKYRELKIGEALQVGDEFWNPRQAKWQPYDSRPGLIIGSIYTPFKYRRPI